MKRFHRRCISGLLVLTMALSFSMPVMAADESDKEAKEQQIEALEQEKEEQNQALGAMNVDKANTILFFVFVATVCIILPHIQAMIVIFIKRFLKDKK